MAVTQLNLQGQQNIIASPFDQALFAALLFCILVLLSMAHKLRHKWSWPGLSWTSIPFAISNVLIVYCFFVYVAYSMTKGVSIPPFQEIEVVRFAQESWLVLYKVMIKPGLTPWFLAGIGLALFNVLGCFKLVSNTKNDFLAQCK